MAQALEPANVTDADIFAFALNLEYLEAEFFTWATTARLQTRSHAYSIQHTARYPAGER